MDWLKPFIPVFVYKRPELAMSAVGITVFVLLMARFRSTYIEKFGFHLGLGVGVGFLAAGTKALRNKYRNLGVLLVYCGPGNAGRCGIGDSPKRPSRQRPR